MIWATLALRLSRATQPTPTVTGCKTHWNTPCGSIQRLQTEGAWPPYVVEGNEVIFNWAHDLATPDMIQTGEISQDLINWTPVVPTVRSENNNLEQLHNRMSFTPQTRNFFRLKAQPAAAACPPPVGP